MTLTEFLLARIAEDEAAARACVYPPHDGYKPHPELSRWFYREGGEVEYVQTPEMLAHKYPERLYVTCDGEGLTPAVGEVHGEHIARHDPARVLAECEAKRRIIERGPSECGGYQSEHGLGTHYPAEGWSYCDGCSAAESADLDWQWIMRHLATVYADHEDYRAEWAL